MTKAIDLVARSLRILRVQDSNSVTDPTDYATAQIALNAMMRRMEADGVSLGWQDIVSSQDDLPLPPEAEEAVAYLLAVKLRPEYGSTLDPDTVQYAKDGLNQLRRDNEVATPLQPILDAPQSLPYGATYFGFGDIYY
jgi:hypothetical protein